MYNIKAINYDSGTQVVVYTRPVIEAKQEKSDKQENNKYFACGFKEKDLDRTKIDYQKVNERKQLHSLLTSVNRSKNQIYYLARSNTWDYMVTFTFNQKFVERYNYDDCVKKLSNWLHEMKKKSKDLIYIVVPEQHKDGAYHFHGLMKNMDGLHITKTRKRYKGKPIYNIDEYALGWCEAVQVDDNVEAVARYITKYITKDLFNSIGNRKRYWASRNIKRASIETMLSTDICGYLDTLTDVAEHEKCIVVNEDTKYYYFDIPN